jgi:capsular polysaccharide biosynthesis protein
MSKLRLFDKIKLNENIPILVGKKLWQMDFFQYVIKNTGLKSYNWQLHSDIYKVNRIIIAVPSSLKTENFNFFLKKSGIVLKQEVPKRVFVNRSVKRGKTIQNLDELISILNKYSIKVVENDDLSFEDQITIYKDAEILIGIHGAGLVNLIYRINKPTGVFEIFHPNKINPHYFWMSNAFNFMYSYMVGDKVNSNDTFYINPTVFEHKILEFIDSFEKQKLR